MNIKGVARHEVAIDLLSGENKSEPYLAISPNGYVPALQIDGQTFSESLAIIEWLEDRFPSPNLLPSSSIDRLRCRQISQMIVAGIQPLQNLSVMRFHSSHLDEQRHWSKHWIEAGLKNVETILRTTAGSYSIGGSLTLADLCLVPQLYNARRFDVDLSQYPIACRIEKNCLDLESCRTSHPDAYAPRG